MVIKMRYFFLSLILIIQVISNESYACLNSDSKSFSNYSDTLKFYKSIKVSRAFRLAKENENNPQFVILDVRKADDFQKEHIANAINIDFKLDDFSVRLDQLDKNKIYMVNCYGGFRSQNTMQLMKEKGFTKVYNVKGGIIKWRMKKLPVVTQN
jgi:rhodanese-related sulfurtransferase